MRLLTIVIFAASLCAAQSPSDWIGFGPNGSLDSKDGVLNFHYTADSAAVSLALLPVSKIPFAGMKSMRFEIRTDSPFAASVLLSEKKPGGGNYSAVVWSNGDSWQPVVLTPADFTVNDGPKDPVDSDGKLDLDQVEHVGLVDLSQFFNALPKDPDAPIYAEPHQGPHLISIRNFEISHEASPSLPSKPSANVLDDFSRPQAAWFSFGGVSLENHDGDLLVRYRQLPEQWVTFSRLAPMSDYRGATHLAMDISSDRPAQLAISIRERRTQGREEVRYNVDFFVPASSKPEHREIALSAFSGEGPMALNNLQSITILDVSRESALNKLTIHDLKLVKK